MRKSNEAKLCRMEVAASHSVPIFMPTSLLPTHDFEMSTSFEAHDNRSLLPDDEVLPPVTDKDTTTTTTETAESAETADDTAPEYADEHSEPGETEASTEERTACATTSECSASPEQTDDESILVEEADPVERLTAKHTAKHLREALRKYDLPTNGTKQAMAVRLVESGVLCIHEDQENDDSVVLVADSSP